MCIQQQITCEDLRAEKFDLALISFLVKAKNISLPWVHVDAKEIAAKDIARHLG